MIDEVTNGVVNVFSGNHVIVVEHEQEALLGFRQLVQQRWHDVAHGIDVRAPERVFGASGEFGNGSTERSNHIRPEDGSGVIALLEP